MANIYNMEDYRNKKRIRQEHVMEQFRQLVEELGTWESPEEEAEFYRRQAREDEADMKAMFAR